MLNIMNENATDPAPFSSPRDKNPAKKLGREPYLRVSALKFNFIKGNFFFSYDKLGITSVSCAARGERP